MMNDIATELSNSDTSCAAVMSSTCCTDSELCKTKCLNDGTGKKCTTIPTNCSDPQLDTAASGSSSESVTSTATGEAEKEATSITDPLSGEFASMLPTEIWEELFRIFERHFFVDFPFLHKARFYQYLSVLREAKSVSKDLRLAFLALTTRPHLTPKDNDFYTPAALPTMQDAYRQPSMRGVQALLMIGYHRLFALQDYAGIADIKTATFQARFLGYHDARSEIVKNNGKGREMDQATFTDNEIRRRTFWSCCLMESYAAWVVKPEPSTWLSSTTIQLPCHEIGFRHGISAKTRFLEEANAAYADRQVNMPSCDYDQNDGEASSYVQMFCLLTEALRWSINKHQRLENVVPQDECLDFERLDNEFKRLKVAVPCRLQKIYANTKYQDDLERSTYIRVHGLIALCEIALSGEYMPFLPWIGKPLRGPYSDRPVFTEALCGNPEPIQNRAWFKATKVFLSIVHHYKQYQHCLSPLTNNPVVGFAMYTMSCALYCNYLRGADVSLILPMLEVTSVFVESIRHQWGIAFPWIQALSCSVPLALHSMYAARRKRTIAWLSTPRKHANAFLGKENMPPPAKKSMPSPKVPSVATDVEPRRRYDPVRDC